MTPNKCPDTVAGLDLSKPAMLEASAGTGKTFAIEHLVLRLLIESENLELPSILILTFAEKAASEIKEKIRHRLAWRIDLGDLKPPALDRLKYALLNFDRASIYTIHGFCQRVLHKYAFENHSLFQTELVEKDLDIFEQVLTEEMRSTWLSEAGTGPEGLAAFRRTVGALKFGRSKSWNENILKIAKSFNPDRGDAIEPIYDPTALTRIEVDLVAACLEIASACPDLIHGKESECALAIRYKDSKLKSRGAETKGRELIASALQTAAKCRDITNEKDRVDLALAFLDTKNKIKLSYNKNYGYSSLLPKPSKQSILPWPELEKVLEQLQTIRDLELKREVELNVRNLAEQRRVIISLREKTQAFIKAKGMITFDSMIEDVAIALREKPERVLRLRQDYRYCLVDEFQDTDPLQWEIFRTIFLESNSSNPLFLIGDPKQAIYRFRGGDIHTYMEAREQLHQLSRQGLAQGRGLEKNHRSSQGMIDACNATFAHEDWLKTLAVDRGNAFWKLPADANPLGFVPVGYGDLRVQVAQDTTSRPHPIVLMDFAVKRPKAPTKPEIKKQVFAWIASEIDALMFAPERLMVPDKVTKDLRPLAWSDICILVKNNDEKTQIEHVLVQRGIPVQINGRSGLYAGDAAGHILALLDALNDPHDSGKHAKALLSRFFRSNGDNLPSRAPEDPHPMFEKWGLLAHRRRWQGLFHSLFYDTGLLYRESLEQDGDRRIMDFLHIGENLTQEALSQNLSLSSLVQKLRDLRAARADMDEDQDLHREDSEGGKILIMTMHKSKGLEFPVVFLAAFSGPRNQPYFKYRDDLRTVYNLNNKDEKAKEEYEKEEKGENCRLYYVALTRARYKLFIPLLPENKPNSSGPLGSFVARALIAASIKQPQLIHHGKINPDLKTSEILSTKIEAPTKNSSLSKKPNSAAGASDLFADFPRDNILSQPAADFSKRRRRLSSYSYLVRNSHELATEDAAGRFDKEEAPITFVPSEDSDTEAASTLAYPGNALPRGRETGVMFHEILENINFAMVASTPTPEALVADEPSREVILGRMRKFRLDESHLPSIAAVIWNTLRAQVPDPAGGAPFRLGDLAERRAEMEFFFPYGGGPNGYLGGFIDLVFRLRGRYYLLDWKSNHLEGYGPGDLEESIRDSHYDLQYMLYSLALDKWLRSLIPDYNHQTHFGGVYYIYLRGMTATAGDAGVPGVHALCPTKDQLRNEYPAHLAKAISKAGGGTIDPAMLLTEKGAENEG